MTPQEIIDVLQAFQDGKQIEYRLKNCKEDPWTPSYIPAWAFNIYEYRVAPKQIKTFYKFLCKDRNNIKHPYYESPAFYTSLKDAQKYYLDSTSTVIKRLDYTKITIEE